MSGRRERQGGLTPLVSVDCAMACILPDTPAKMAARSPRSRVRTRRTRRRTSVRLAAASTAAATSAEESAPKAAA
jgi:hypothetical protein